MKEENTSQGDYVRLGYIGLGLDYYCPEVAIVLMRIIVRIVLEGDVKVVNCDGGSQQRVARLVGNCLQEEYFLNNQIILEYQFGFLPGRSTQLAVFELSKQIYSALNNKKTYGIENSNGV